MLEEGGGRGGQSHLTSEPSSPVCETLVTIVPSEKFIPVKIEPLCHSIKLI